MMTIIMNLMNVLCHSFLDLKLLLADLFIYLFSIQGSNRFSPSPHGVYYDVKYIYIYIHI